MTSPRQRKKRAAFLAQQKLDETVETKSADVEVFVVTQPAQEAGLPSQPVVVSEPIAGTSESKPKKPAKNGFVEIKEKEKVKSSVDQVIEQVVTEVKTLVKE